MDFDVVPSCKYIGSCYYNDNFSYFSVCALEIDDQVYIQLAEKGWGSIAVPAKSFTAYLIGTISGLPIPTEAISGYYIISSKSDCTKNQANDKSLSCKFELTRKFGDNLSVQPKDSFFNWYINKNYIQEILELIKDPNALIVGE